MVDLKIVLGSLATSAAFKVLAIADAAEIPDVNTFANLSATGALIFMVLWMTTKTLPNMTKDFREELQKNRDAHEKDRERWVCRFYGDPHQPQPQQRIQ